MTSYAGVDSTLGLVLDKHAEQAKLYEDISARLKAADGDRAAALAAYVQTSDDPEVVKLRKAIEAANAKLQSLAEKNVVSESLSEDDKNKLKAEQEELKSQFRDGRKAILSIAETMKAMIDVDKVKAALEEIGDPTRSGRGRKVGDTGSNLPKASATLVVKNANDTWTVQTFGEAAKLMSIPVEKLQKVFAKAAKVEHADIASVTTPQTFTVNAESLEDSEYKQTFSVSTTPKARKKPGPRPGGNATTKAA